MTRRLPLLLFGTVAAPAAAQQAPAAQAPEIVVTGRGLADAPGDRAFDVVTIGPDRLAADAADRLESVLADAAGLQQFRRSDSTTANPTSQGLTLRGLGGNAASRALLVLDGVPQTDPFGGWVAFPAYSPDRLGRVRIVRGGGGGYEGPGALAGTIELESAGPADLGPFAARVDGGSRGSVEASGESVLTRGGGFATLAASYAHGDGFTPTIPAQQGPVDRPAPYEQASIAARTVLSVGAATELQLNASAFTDRRDRGTDYTRNLSQGADASVRLVGRGPWGWSALAYLQTRAFASGFASINTARTTVTPTLDQYDTPATGLGGRLEVQPPVGARAALRLGADVRDVDGVDEELYSYTAGVPTRRRETGGDNLTGGVFADASREAGRWTLTAGGRIDWWRIGDGFLTERPLAGGAATADVRYPTRTGTEPTGRAGLAWRPLGGVTLRGAAYRGWRLPTLNELYRPYRVGADATGANAALSPERLGGYEGGVTLAPAPRVSVAATWYDNRLAGAISNVTLGQGPGTFPQVGAVTGVYRLRENVDAIRARGLELDAGWRPGEVGVRASWSHVASRVEASGAAAALDGLVPAEVPRDQVSGTLEWAWRGWAASATARYVGRQFDDDQNKNVLNAATTLDAYLAAPLTRRLALEARAENLTDTLVEAAISGPGIIERATPRTLWLGLRWRGR